MLLFASMAQAAGVRKLDLKVDPGSRVADLCAALFAAFPDLRRFEPTLLYALNEEYVRPETALVDGATLALIPPVSGG